MEKREDLKVPIHEVERGTASRVVSVPQRTSSVGHYERIKRPGKYVTRGRKQHFWAEIWVQILVRGGGWGVGMGCFLLVTLGFLGLCSLFLVVACSSRVFSPLLCFIFSFSGHLRLLFFLL